MGYKAPRENEVSPVISQGHRDSTVTNHPAFGQISVSRRQAGGDGVNLYDSDFGHNSYVSVAIKKSELHRDLSYDRHHDTSEIVEVDMSESQWATFVSSFNLGGGVPCTLTWVKGEGRIPGIPAFDRSEVFKKEMKETTQEAVSRLKNLIGMIDELGISQKKKDSVLHQANMALQSLTSSVPFVQDQFDEHVEKTVERGIQEIHGYMNAAINRSGLAALKNEQAPLYLEGVKDD